MTNSSKIAMFRQYLEKKPGDRFAMYGIALELKKEGDVDGAAQRISELTEARRVLLG